MDQFIAVIQGSTVEVERCTWGIARDSISSRERPTVLTVLERPLRSQFDIAAGHLVRAVHAGSITEALDRATANAVSATVLSANATSLQPATELRRLIGHEGAGITFVVIDDIGSVSNSMLLGLGSFGIREIVDLRTRDGWTRLRQLLADKCCQPGAEVRWAVRQVLRECSDGAARFFDSLVWTAPRTLTVKQFAAELSVVPSTLCSRFLRVGLPSPKRYLAQTRFLYAAVLLGDRMTSAARVAAHLRYSSPQAFARQVRRTFGLTVGEFRYRYSGMRFIDRYAAELIEPHRDTLFKIETIVTGRNKARIYPTSQFGRTTVT